MNSSLTQHEGPTLNPRNSLWRITRSAICTFTAATVIAACGGGGSGGGASSASAPTVSSATVGPVKFSQAMVLTVIGSNLDQGLAASASGCDGISLGVPSSATTAQYQCVASAVGPGQIVLTRSGDGVVLASVAFNVPLPQVTITVGNGAAVAGTLLISLAADKTPITVRNFLDYVNSGFYVGTVFHRVSPGFVIQGGGYVAPLDSSTQTLKPTSTAIALEVGKGLSNLQWTIGMARLATPVDSATSQFFINLADNSGSLDPSPLSGAGYAVFGTVSGIDTVAKIVGAPCTAIPALLPSGECTPIPNVVITSAVQSQ